ncbi:capsule biosynthesis protein CapA [Actibacterium mucosum KCTC 23349]|uniref:Capsule biosynthesis protein CapA n=1 Tax=Actibacterium mucosum KCTC 23349 TaxID=1454373 RepID=A0A037ZIB8_9RHOB|nr:capsule biosynthesis protein CapA [Actibacterium mucosum KCTC 23349]
MTGERDQSRHFLFLQGPHGPFFARLAAMLTTAGHKVCRVGFNRGDQMFWTRSGAYHAFTDSPENWRQYVAKLVEAQGITDLVLYGDTRPMHAQAIEVAKWAGLQIHVFEEGYLRPYWVTYERNGSNGHSRLMQVDVADMQSDLDGVDADPAPAPARWGDMRHHIFYGALYHFQVMFRNGTYDGFRPHRDLSVSQEFQLYLKRLVSMPFRALDRAQSTMRVRYGGFPYHLVLLQLEHDASFQTHSPFSSMTEFLQVCIEGFAKGAPKHHHMVFKAHPLEDGRAPLRREIRRLARKLGVANRVHYVPGGKLAALLDHARSAITVNSTAAQQVLWRGLPLKVFGDAVFAKPEFVSTQALPEFFTRPKRPDARAYRDYRRYLLETSQIPGGFYSSRGRRYLLRQVVDLMLSPDDPYDMLRLGHAAPRQALQVVH